ncbi:MAG TPA: lipid-A-disaccharide synthase [Nevskiaceae bacterium]|nr:lipid-A-disaccharide synthase [Nevskiaceae bacterium]
MRFALVAGEASGDFLGGALITALRAKFPDATFYGIAGPQMIAAGCEAIDTIDSLSVMGIGEILRDLPRLMKLRSSTAKRFAADRPDCFIGIDSPDFTLYVERRVREAGIKTVHYVSPTVWAWRQGRVKGIAKADDLMLCLFPFEPKFYADHHVKAAYVGHPLADELDDSVTPAQARAALGIATQGKCVGILPGSRHGELKYLAEPFAQTAAWLAKRDPSLRFLVPIAKPSLRGQMEAAIAAHAPGSSWHLFEGHSRDVMRASDVVLLASGTATLETLLLGRPMVVGYQGSGFTAFLLLDLGMLKTKYVSLPNLLCAEPVVPELLRDRATAEHFGPAVAELLEQPAARERQLKQFSAVRGELKQDAAARAADAIARLLNR